MTLIGSLRAAGRRQVLAASMDKTKGGVSGGLRERLGEELAAMLEKVGRKVYAAGTERTRKAIADALLANRSVLTAAIQQEFGRRGATRARKAVHEWLDEIVGEMLTDVAEQVYEDLPQISKALVEELSEAAEDMPPEDEEPEVEEEGEEEEVEEEPEEEPEEEGEEPEAEADAQELQEIADELEEIKASGLAQATRLARSGQSDSAAYLRMILEQL